MSLSKQLLTAVLFVSSLVPSSLFMTNTAHAEDRTIAFSGYTWNVRGDWWAYPGPNSWNNDDGAVSVDAQGRLHLKVTQRHGAWYSSEVYLPASLGYGTYQFDVESPLNQVDTNVVVSPFLYQDDTHEFDIEFSDWRSPGSDKGQFVIQPGQMAGNVSRYDVSAATGISSHVIHWAPNNVYFQSSKNGQIMHEWDYRGSGNFVPGREKLHINMWMIDGWAPSSLQEQEIIINRFTFTPYNGSSRPTVLPTSEVINSIGEITSSAAVTTDTAPAAASPTTPSSSTSDATVVTSPVSSPTTTSCPNRSRRYRRLHNC